MANTGSHFNRTEYRTELAELTKSDYHILNQTQTRKTINFDDDEDDIKDIRDIRDIRDIKDKKSRTESF